VAAPALSLIRGTHPFKLAGTVVGPGGGVAKINASGEVYKLASVANFPGRYTQSQVVQA
jgi:hypothetical protein